MGKLLSWLRQTTTVQGIAVAVLTGVANVAGGAPLWATLGGEAASLVLLAMPGQGDLSGKVGKLVADIGGLVATGGSGNALAILARDGIVLAGSLPPTAAVIPVTQAGARGGLGEHLIGAHNAPAQ